MRRARTGIGQTFGIDTASIRSWILSQCSSLPRMAAAFVQLASPLAAPDLDAPFDIHCTRPWNTSDTCNFGMIFSDRWTEHFYPPVAALSANDGTCTASEVQNTLAGALKRFFRRWHFAKSSELSWTSAGICRVAQIAVQVFLGESITCSTTNQSVRQLASRLRIDALLSPRSLLIRTPSETEQTSDLC